MRITLYNPGANPFYKLFTLKHKELTKLSYSEILNLLNGEAYAWANFWNEPMARFGYDFQVVYGNLEALQRAWARENGIKNSDDIELESILIEQFKKNKTEVLFFNSSNEALLEKIKSSVSSLKLIVGWEGSALSSPNAWKSLDLILSCAPEAVEYLRGEGLNAEHLNHAFAPVISERLGEVEKRRELIFTGQIIRASEYHNTREDILKRLFKMGVELEIFSSSFQDVKIKSTREFVKYCIIQLINIGKKVGLDLQKAPIIKNMYLADQYSKPLFEKLIRPGIYGIDMYRSISESKISLNIHADSSPRFASNMRLFETTGVGTCLVTDWRDNITELFEPDKEIITYKSAEECAEKVRWLLEHPSELESIAKAGQARTLKDHTFENRAFIFDKIIKKYL